MFTPCDHPSFRHFSQAFTCFAVIGWLGMAQFFAQTAQDFQHYSVEDGLSQSTVFAITQDQEGFVWVGTRHGLNRFDAYEFQAFHSQAEQEGGLINDDIRSLSYDSTRNCLWVGTIRGLTAFDPASQSFRALWTDSVSPLSSLRINALLVDQNDAVWAGTEAGLFHLALGETEFQLVDGTFFASVQCLYQDRKGILWIGTNGGLYQIAPSSPSAFVHTPHVTENLRPESEQIRAIVEDEVGNLWIGTWEGLFVLDTSR
ncbi:MAG: two-component regulator propeller domain-containing protein, partial [Bacteroidota bacterium]